MVLALAASWSGCGTIYTRTNRSPVGRYPFDAVALDLWMLPMAFTGRHEVLGESKHGKQLTALGLLSLPIDLVLDTVLLPVDGIAWLFGAIKRDDHESIHANLRFVR